jgi:hypothetical protein
MSEKGTIKKALIEELVRLHDELGVAPRTVDMGKHGRFSPALYAKRWGSWEAALEAAGIEGDPGRPPEDVSVEGATGPGKQDTEDDDKEPGSAEEEPSDESLMEIRRCDKRIEGTPMPEDLRGRGHSVNEVLDEHGTWKDALEAAGVEAEYLKPSPDDRRQNGGRRVELLDELRRYAKLHGERPSAKDLRRTDWATSPEEYSEAFGGVQEALTEAFDDDGERGEEKLLKEIKRYYLREGDVPDTEDVRSTDRMSSVERYREVFGGVGQAVEESSLNR